MALQLPRQDQETQELLLTTIQQVSLNHQTKWHKPMASIKSRLQLIKLIRLSSIVIKEE